MSTNCLKTQLKQSVNNSDLPFLPKKEIRFNIVDCPGHNDGYIGSFSSIKIIKDGVEQTVTTSYNATYKAYHVNGIEGTYEMIITDDFGPLTILNCGIIFNYCEIDVSLFGNRLIGDVLLGSGFKGNIETLCFKGLFAEVYQYNKIRVPTFNSKLKGEIEKCAKNLVLVGQTNGSLSIECPAGSGNITYNKNSFTGTKIINFGTDMVDPTEAETAQGWQVV